MKRSTNDQIKRVQHSGKVTGRTLLARRRKALPQEAATPRTATKKTIDTATDTKD